MARMNVNHPVLRYEPDWTLRGNKNNTHNRHTVTIKCGEKQANCGKNVAFVIRKKH